MDIRTLQYFLAVAREESISGAAEFLHMTQPPLSRQLKELEAELGKQLFIRGNRKITLTEDGMILRKRAEEIAFSCGLPPPFRKKQEQSRDQQYQDAQECQRDKIGNCDSRCAPGDA